MTRRTFEYVTAGDVVTRILGGAPMRLTVTSVDDELIHCGEPGVGWSFDRVTGVEVDHELGWGPMYGIAGSYLVHDGEQDSDWVDAPMSGTKRRH